MNTKQILTEAADLLADPKNWCQGFCATTSKGRQVVAGSPHARRWDIAGAISKVGGREDGPRVVAIAETAARACGYASLSAFNDFSDHDIVVAFMKGLIEDAQ